MKQKFYSLAFLLLYASFIFCIALTPFQTEEANGHCAMSSGQNADSVTCCEEVQEFLSQNVYFPNEESGILFLPQNSQISSEYFLISDALSFSVPLSNPDPPPDIPSHLSHKKTVVLIR